MHCLKALSVAQPALVELFLKDATKRLFSHKSSIMGLPCHHQQTKSTMGHRRYPLTRILEHFHLKMCVRTKSLCFGTEDMLFYTITEGRDQVSISSFISALRKTGLHPSDPRLKDCMERLRQAVKDSPSDVMMDRDLFHRCVGGNIVLLIQAFRKKFIIPEFDAFARKINEIYDTVEKNTGGQVIDYIPHLAKFSPELWGVSLCTVDGQRHSVGDTKLPFCLQSCVKPLEYALAVHEIGTEKVHRYVGMEPSGLKFNKLSLDEEENEVDGETVDCGLTEQMIGFLFAGSFKKQIKFRQFVEKYKEGETEICLQPIEPEEASQSQLSTVLSAEPACGSVEPARVRLHHIGICPTFPHDVQTVLDARDPRLIVPRIRHKITSVLYEQLMSHNMFALSSLDMDLKDYDSRTALHIAAAEGHVEVVRFLIENCKVNPFVEDRWGNFPMDDAKQFGHSDVVEVLKDYHVLYNQKKQETVRIE